MKKMQSFLWGAILICIGILLICNTFDIIHFNIFFKGWWTVFIIIPTTIGLITEKDKVGNLIGLLIGVFLLLGVRDVLNYSMILKLLLPIILIIVGISIMFKNTIKNNITEKIDMINKKNKENSNGNNYTAIFSSDEINFNKQDFNGANMLAVFGGLDINLRNSNITENQVINCTSIFGGIDVYVPSNVIVKVSSRSVFGGVTNKANQEIEDEDKKIIYINAVCVFGGIDIS